MAFSEQAFMDAIEKVYEALNGLVDCFFEGWVYVQAKAEDKARAAEKLRGDNKEGDGS